jgi:hypothetical protein
LGNQRVTQLIQAKFASHPGNRYEQEADRVAEQITSLPSPESSTAAQRQPKKVDPGTFKPRKMTLEDVVKEMNGLGGPYKDLKAWTDTFKPGKFLGHPIAAGSWSTKGVRPEFQALLDTAETKVNDEYKKSGNPIPKGYGIRSIGGFRGEISVHGAGVAIDIDGGDNPYIMHESDTQWSETTLRGRRRPGARPWPLGTDRAE